MTEGQLICFSFYQSATLPTGPRGDIIQGAVSTIRATTAYAKALVPNGRGSTDEASTPPVQGDMTLYKLALESAFAEVESRPRPVRGSRERRLETDAMPTL